MTHDRGPVPKYTLQLAEYAAVKRLAKALCALPPIADESHATFRAYYESAAADLIEAFRENGRQIAPSRETQASINAWHQEHFPNATLEGVLGHLREEFHEFLDAQTLAESAIEAADLVIILYSWAALNGVDLHAAIDAKMSINRAREWNIQPDGTGRHK